MSGFGEYAVAMRARDLFESIARSIVDRERPRYRYGVVTGFNRTTSKCDVQFPGEDFPITVSMGSIQPSAIGQTVRVGGVGTDRFVDDVMGKSYRALSGLADVSVVGAPVDKSGLIYDAPSSLWKPAPIGVSPNVVNLVANCATVNPIATLSFTVQEQSKIRLTGYFTAFATTTGLKTVTATCNGVTTTIGHLYFNEVSSHKDIPVFGVLGPFPAGTYSITITVANGGWALDANDFYNIILQEQLPGGWSAPDIVDSGWGRIPGVTGTDIAGFQVMQYHKIGDLVELRGLAQYVGGWTNGTTVGTLPLGSRPPLNEVFEINTGAGAQRCDVQADGKIIIYGTGSNQYLSLSGIHFRTTV